MSYTWLLSENYEYVLVEFEKFLGSFGGYYGCEQIHDGVETSLRSIDVAFTVQAECDNSDSKLHVYGMILELNYALIWCTPGCDVIRGSDSLI